MNPRAASEAVRTATRKSLRRYMTGFLLSIITTLIVYGLVQSHLGNGHAVISNSILTIIVAFLAGVQVIVQVIYFLHLGGENHPRIRLFSFVFLIIIVSILIVGSLWIMNNLNYHSMTPQQINTYVQSQSSGGF